jgi:NAD(P)-dependent dehydrogenase (short-subunit alcohol dehydrogenase family)
MPDFNDAVVVVTGGGSGIGKQTARRFGELGASVVVGDVDVDGGHATVTEIRDDGGHAEFVKTDVGDADDVETLIETTVSEFGQLDVAFNNAGIGDTRVPIEEKEEADWQRVLDVNLTGVFRCLKYELAAMKQAGTGAIVNNASVMGKVGTPNAAAYVAAKHGVVGLTKAAALEAADAGIRVNAVCPGFMGSRVTAGEDDTFDAETLEELRARHPIGRLGAHEDVASAVTWLSSEEASFVTGEALNVDGGYLVE